MSLGADVQDAVLNGYGNPYGLVEKDDKCWQLENTERQGVEGGNWCCKYG